MTPLPEHLQGDGPCDTCGTRDNPRWFTESIFWNQVMGGPEAMGDPGGLLCITCFIVRADRAGMRPTTWQLIPQWPWRQEVTA